MACEAQNLVVTRFLGLSRSGNHAIIDWVLRQLEAPWVFLNCVEPERDPFRNARPLDDGRCRIEAPGRGGPLQHLLFSQEDCFLRSAWGDRATRIHEKAVAEHLGAQGARWRDILILRDPYNLFASRRRFRHPLVPEQTARRIWKQHAKAHLGKRTSIRTPILNINYDRWATDAYYRRELACCLQLSFTDAGLDAVPRCGGGSSFDGHLFQGRASQMAVQQRWHHFVHDPGFRQLFDPELQELAEPMFGLCPWAKDELAAPPEVQPADKEVAEAA